VILGTIGGIIGSSAISRKLQRLILVLIRNGMNQTPKHWIRIVMSLLAVLMLLLSYEGKSQIDSIKFINEFSVTGNYTASFNNEIMGKPGFGIGGYVFPGSDNWVSPVFGIEYNYSQHFRSYYANDDEVTHFGRTSWTDVSLNSKHLPFQ